MATYKYKFMLLNDDDSSTSQSRGLSLQFNGYVPFNGPVDTTSLPDIESLIEDGSIMLMFEGLNYIADADQNIKSADSRYAQYKSNPASYMFKGISAVPSAEFATVDNDGISRGSTTLDIPLYDTMLGDRLQGEARVDGIILYGQAYNVDFYNPTAQGQIEKAVPLALVVFTDNKPTLDSSSEVKSMSNFRMALSFRVFGEEDGLTVEDTEEYRTWKAFEGNFHVVNNDMLTTSSFILRGRGVEAIANSELSEDENLWKEGKTVDFGSKVFFTNDIDGSNYDHNVDFGSPARLTVLNREIPSSGSLKTPQTLIGKVSYDRDENDYLHCYWDGVTQSYYCAMDQKDGMEVPVSGSVYDMDWISNEKPAISLFSVNNDFAFCNSAYGPESACFANGTNITSDGSLSCGDGMNVNTTDVETRGNAMVLNSKLVRSTSIPTQDGFKYDTFVANSERVFLSNRVYPTDGVAVGPTKTHNAVINSYDVIVNNDTSGNSLMNTENGGRVTVMASENVYAENVDNIAIFGGTKYSKIMSSRDDVIIGGSFEGRYSFGNTIIGTGTVVNDYNYLNGIEYTQDGDTKYCTISDSVVIGKNNTITTAGRNIAPKSVKNVIEVGNDLMNDTRQNQNDLNCEKYNTLILGQSNTYYHEDKKAKALVLGGYRSSAWQNIPEFKYNAFEISQNSPEAFDYPNIEVVWNKESVASLTDVKGRKIDYGSSSIDLKYLEANERTAENYNDYNYHNFGRINLFKLYDLLAHMVWIPEDGASDYGGYVRFVRDGNGSPDTRWFSRDIHWIGNNKYGTVLADLVDDTKSQWPYQIKATSF